MKKYRVHLTDAEVLELQDLIISEKYKNTKLKRGQILLGANESVGGKCMTDEEIKRAYDVSLRTIERTRKRFVEDSYELDLRSFAFLGISKASSSCCGVVMTSCFKSQVSFRQKSPLQFNV
mgnify:CR=1 FL=1